MDERAVFHTEFYLKLCPRKRKSGPYRYEALVEAQSDGTVLYIRTFSAEAGSPEGACKCLADALEAEKKKSK